MGNKKRKNFTISGSGEGGGYSQGVYRKKASNSLYHIKKFLVKGDERKSKKNEERASWRGAGSGLDEGMLVKTNKESDLIREGAEQKGAQKKSESL